MYDIHAAAAATANRLGLDPDALAAILAARLANAPRRLQADALSAAILALLEAHTEAASNGDPLTLADADRIAADAVEDFRKAEKPPSYKPHRGRRVYPRRIGVDSSPRALVADGSPETDALLAQERERLTGHLTAPERQALELLGEDCYRTRSVRNVQTVTGLSRRRIANLQRVLNELHSRSDETPGRMPLLDRVVTPSRDSEEIF